MTPTDLSAWMTRNGLDTIVGAATALGMGRNTVAQYLSGKQAIPRYVELACKGLEAERTLSANRC